MKNIGQSGRQPKYSSWSVVIPPCELRNLVAERCRITNLRCRTILPAQTLLSQQVPCLGVTEYGEKGQRNFHAVTWLSISRDAVPATAQGNHKCPSQSKVQFHAGGQDKKGRCIDRKQESILKSEVWTYISSSQQNTNSVFGLASFIPAGATGRHVTRWEQVFFHFLLSAAVTKTHGWTTSLIPPDSSSYCIPVSKVGSVNWQFMSATWWSPSMSCVHQKKTRTSSSHPRCSCSLCSPL